MLDIGAIIGMRGSIARVVRRCGVREHDVDDVVQETLIGAWRAAVAGGYRPAADTPAALSAWLRGIAWRQATNCTRAAWRRRERAHEPDELHELAGDTTPPDELLVECERQRRAVALLRGLDSLDANALAVVRAHHFDGLPMTRAAAQLGIPLSTAWSRHRRALRALAANEVCER